MTLLYEQDYDLWAKQMADLLASGLLSWILTIWWRKFAIYLNGSAIACWLVWVWLCIIY